MQYWIVKSGTKEVISGPFETQDEANKEMARFPVGGDAKTVTQGNYLGNGLLEAVQPGMTFKIDWDGESIIYVEYVRDGKVGLIRLNRPKTASGQPIRPEDKIEMSIEEFEASAKPVNYNPVSKKFESIYDLEKAKEELQYALQDLRDAKAAGEDKEVIKELQDEVKRCREVLNSLSESASYEKDMDENKPVVVKGVKGVKSTPFVKKFKNMAAYEKWADSEAAENFEVQQVMNESAVFDFSTTNDADILKVSAALEKAGIPFEVEEKGESFVVKVLDSRDQLVASELIGDTMKESDNYTLAQEVQWGLKDLLKAGLKDQFYKVINVLGIEGEVYTVPSLADLEAIDPNKLSNAKNLIYKNDVNESVGLTKDEIVNELIDEIGQAISDTGDDTYEGLSSFENFVKAQDKASYSWEELDQMFDQFGLDKENLNWFKSMRQESWKESEINEMNESAQLSPFERVGFNPVYSEDGKKATVKIFSECEMEKFNKIIEAYLNTYIESIEYKVEESDNNCLCVIEVKLVQSPETKGDPETMMKELKTESVLVENEIMDQVLNSIAVFLKSNSNLVVSDSHNSPKTYSENGVEFGYSYSSQTRPPIVTVSLLDDKLSLLGLLTEPPKFVMRANFSGLHSVSSLKSANLDRAKSSLIQQLQNEKTKSTEQIDQLLKIMQ